MVKNYPEKNIIVQEEAKKDYPRFALDVSWAFEISMNPVLKSVDDILKANLVQVNDKEFLNRIKIEPLDKSKGSNKDWLWTVKWSVKNETSSTWPENTENLVLKCLSNDLYIKLADVPIWENEMHPKVMQPDEISEITLKFLLPYSIRQGYERNKKTINIIFSLYDAFEKKYYGANLPCTIPL